MRSKRITVILFVTIAMVLFAMILFIPMQESLIFYEEDTSNVAAFLPMNEGQKFDIIWTHSIHLTDVVEKYQINAEQAIEQYEIIYEHFGIGMPSNALEGETFESKDGKYHVKDLENVFPTMNIRNGKTVSNHRLIWYKGGEEHQIYFNDFFQPGAWFTVKVDKLSLFQTWREVKIHD